jgi:ATP-dependent Lhr-like helicase
VSCTTSSRSVERRRAGAGHSHRRAPAQVDGPEDRGPRGRLWRLAEPIAIPSGPASQGTVRPSIWSSIHPRLLELIRGHRSTLIFVNSRRLAERLASALNELAGETLVRSHHGSIAREQRVESRGRAQGGTLRALVATSSLELGIDMGAIDLVIQIEAPPSVASGLQRIGRARHQVNASSERRHLSEVPWRSHRLRRRHPGHARRHCRVEPLSRGIRSTCSPSRSSPWSHGSVDGGRPAGTIRRIGALSPLARRTLRRRARHAVGRYPSDEFAELRPR